MSTAPGRRRRSPLLDAEHYRLLSDFRYLIRCFLEFSESAAAAAGLTARQHQALLAIKGAADGAVPTVGFLAERLRIQHHSAVELVDRLAQAGLVKRMADAQDRRRVQLALMPLAERHLAALSAGHWQELQQLRPALLEILGRAEEDDSQARTTSSIT